MENRPYVPPEQRRILPPLPTTEPISRFKINDSDVPFWHLYRWHIKWAISSFIAFLTVIPMLFTGALIILPVLKLLLWILK